MRVEGVRNVGEFAWTDALLLCSIDFGDLMTGGPGRQPVVVVEFRRFKQ